MRAARVRLYTLDNSLRRNGERHSVYRRTGRPCYRCSTLIELVRQGQLKRATYRCPGCQRRPLDQQAAAVRGCYDLSA